MSDEVRRSVDQITTAKFDFPTEVIDLPSMGSAYPSDSPLSDGTIEIKYMTAREEDILTSNNLINKGIVFDKLLESIIVSPDVKIDDLLMGDKYAILVTSRIMAYGAEYLTQVTCPECGHVTEVEVNLSELKDKDVDLPKNNKNEFGFNLPQSNKQITFKLLTHGDNIKIKDEVETWEKLNKGKDVANADMSIRYKYMITSVDGKRDKNSIKNFIRDAFTIGDIRAFRKHVHSLTPGIDMTFNFNCEACDYAERISVPFGIDFFWPPEEL